MNRRDDRREAIRELIRDGSIRTQHDVAAALESKGYECTQATVSRDVTEMGLLKLSDGSYVLSEDIKLQRTASDFVLEVKQASNIVLVKAASGSASTVAASLDAADYPGMLGSVAGDDTILVVTQDEPSAVALRGFLERLTEHH